MLMGVARCPRCKELFERGERFCKHCGIRKGTPLAEAQFCLVGIVFDVLLVGLLTSIQHIFSPFRGTSFGLAAALSCFGFPLNVALLLFPLLYLGFTYQLILLRKRGVTTRGRAIGNETQMVGRHGDIPRFVSVIEFEADLDPRIHCRIEHSSWTERRGWLPIGSEADVLYDPYNPRGNACIGKKIPVAKLVLQIIFCIFLLCSFGGLVFLLIFF
ncbi:MAG: hypothetical protein M3Y81_17110 [Chloroflexota bacterium]|nr:hypothetical protein [Chloroflexota bacterium]